jgi:hypothetical protein
VKINPGWYSVKFILYSVLSVALGLGGGWIIAQHLNGVLDHREADTLAKCKAYVDQKVR